MDFETSALLAPIVINGRGPWQITSLSRSPTQSPRRRGEIMPDSIADAAVALSLMLEALRLLDGGDHATAAALLRQAINALSPEGARGPSTSGGIADPSER